MPRTAPPAPPKIFPVFWNLIPYVEKSWERKFWERKLDEASKMVGRVCVHVRILSACLAFCQRIQRSRQAEAKVFTIMCVTQKKPKVLCTLLSKQGSPLRMLTSLMYSGVANTSPINPGITPQTQNFQKIKVTRKVRKRQYRNPLFGHIGDEISKNREKNSTLGFNGAWNSV